MGKIGAELRKKYRSPKEALKALGLDESLLDLPRKLAFDGAKKMTKPTRLEYLCVMGAAKAINPLLKPTLATDERPNYGKIFSGVTRSNFNARKPAIVADIKKAIKGRTIAQDASVEHLAKMLDAFEHVKEPKFDESVSGEQHRAMEAAAHGHSNLGIPANVGKEFEHADKGKSFSDAIPAFLKGKGMSDDDCAKVMDMMQDEMPDNALDEEEKEGVNVEIEEGEDKMKAKDGEIEEEEAEDEIEEEEAEDEIEEEEGEDSKHAKDRHAKDKHAKDKHAKDRKDAKDRKGAMDSKKFVTQDEADARADARVQEALKAERLRSTAAIEARAFVRPYVGEVALALDSAAQIHRAAAKILNVEDADTVHPSALPGLIKAYGRLKMANDSDGSMRLAMDGSNSVGDAYELFPDAARIQNAG